MVSPVIRGAAIALAGAALLLAGCQTGAGRAGARRGAPEPAETFETARVETPFETRWEAMTRDERVAWTKKRYVKREYRVPVRDGVYLFANAYIPRDASPTKTYPILLVRTPYSCAPYGEDAYADNPGPAGVHYLESGYIFVKSDVRGRNMSEGLFDDMRAHVENKERSVFVHDELKPGDPVPDGKGGTRALQPGEWGHTTRTERLVISDSNGLQPPVVVDESTDTWDTIEWLVKNVEGNSGKVGMWGISYPGFYCSAGMIDAHPALKAVSPQAPIGDWWFDDFFHHGAFWLPHNVNFFAGFGKARPTLTPGAWGGRLDHGTPDGYQFFLDLGSLKNVNEKHFKDSVAFWNEIVEHPNYDSFWQSRNILPHLKRIAPEVMVVGGWFDAEDLYGAINTYGRANAQNAQAGPGSRREPGAPADAVNTMFVIGPWSHGGWHRSEGDFLGNVSFDAKTSLFYQDLVEFPFFERTLKGRPAPEQPEAYVFETGANKWRRFDAWPPSPGGAEAKTLWFNAGGALGFEKQDAESASAPGFDEYTTDPMKPAPYIEEVAVGMTRQYMTDDQRFASRRPDVLTYKTEALKEDVTIAGPMTAELWVSIAGAGAKCDSDFIVKLIDVFPPDMKDNEHTRTGVRMGGYQMLVRSEAFRGRFRNSYEKPEPFTEGEPTLVRVPVQDVLHTFKKGHRVMVQVQSAWFPLVDRNPQKWVDNIFKADDADFTKATQRVYREGDRRSGLRVTTLGKDALDKAAVPEAEAYELRPKKKDEAKAE